MSEKTEVPAISTQMRFNLAVNVLLFVLNTFKYKMNISVALIYPYNP